MSRDHFAAITTPYGSVVTLTGLTEQEAGTIARDAASDRPVARPERASDGGTRLCTNCQGKGGWMERVETQSAGGSTVVTEKWVRCRLCKGNGAVPIRS